LYLTFPWDKLKERIESEFARSQQQKGARAWRLEIESMSGYWLSGIELQGAKIIMPPDEEDDDDKRPAARGALSKVTTNARAKKAAAADEEAEASDAEDDKDADKPQPPKESVVLIEDAHARV